MNTTSSNDDDVVRHNAIVAVKNEHKKLRYSVYFV
jgi:hypothetical protein